jgi:hypothetical protein
VNRPPASDNIQHAAGAFPSRGASSDFNDCLNGIGRQSASHIFQTVFEYEAYGLAQTGLRLLNRLTLTVRTRHLGANGPVTAFGRFLDNPQ